MWKINMISPSEFIFLDSPICQPVTWPWLSPPHHFHSGSFMGNSWKFIKMRVWNPHSELLRLSWIYTVSKATFMSTFVIPESKVPYMRVRKVENLFKIFFNFYFPFFIFIFLSIWSHLPNNTKGQEMLLALKRHLPIIRSMRPLPILSRYVLDTLYFIPYTFC